VGHADLSNLSNLWMRRIYAKGSLSVSEAVDVATKNGEGVHASEGEYTEPEMLAQAFEDILHDSFLQDGDDRRRWKRAKGKTSLKELNVALRLMGAQPLDLDHWSFRIYEPVHPLSQEQLKALSRWLDDGVEEEEEVAAFDSIPWRFAPGRRAKYPDLPILGNITK